MNPAELADPINRIQWLAANTLQANHYNPNVVFNKELTLLERSLLSTGWIQPILVSVDHIIIDGFHRWRLSLDSKAIMARYAGFVPCAVLNVEPWQAMLLTIRINRAKGSHVAVAMSAIVKELIDVHGIDPQQIAGEIGGDMAEVDLLYQDSIFKAKNLKDYAYSKAWVPAEDGKRFKD